VRDLWAWREELMGDIKDKLRAWKEDCVLFAKEVMGIEVSTEQAGCLRHLEAKEAAKAKPPK